MYASFFNTMDLKIIRECTCGTCYNTMQSIAGPYFVLCKEFKMAMAAHQSACDEYMRAPIGWGAY